MWTTQDKYGTGFCPTKRKTQARSKPRAWQDQSRAGSMRAKGLPRPPPDRPSSIHRTEVDLAGSAETGHAHVTTTEHLSRRQTARIMFLTLSVRQTSMKPSLTSRTYPVQATMRRGSSRTADVMQKKMQSQGENAKKPKTQTKKRNPLLKFSATRLQIGR